MGCCGKGALLEHRSAERKQLPTTSAVARGTGALLEHRCPEQKQVLTALVGARVPAYLPPPPAWLLPPLLRGLLAMRRGRGPPWAAQP